MASNTRLDPGIDPTPVWSANLVKIARTYPDLPAVLFTKPVAERTYRFQPAQVEILLNQAQELLDRLQRETREYDDLRGRALEVSLQAFLEAQELVNLKRRLEPAKDIPDGEAASPIAVFKLAAEAALQDLTAAKKSSDREEPAPWDTTRSAYWAAAERYLGDAQEAYKDDPGYQKQIIVDKFKVMLDIHARQLLVPGYIRRAQLEISEAEQFEHSLEYLSDIASVKAQALNENGPFNFAPRLKALEEQLKVDMDDVVMRVAAIDQGLKDYFGYDRTANYARPPIYGTKNTLKDWIIWTRKAAAWAVAYSHADQYASVLLPLSRVAGPEWTQQLSKLNNGDECSYKFTWDGDEVGKNYFHCRFRGVSATIASGAATLVQAHINLPKRARVRHPAGEQWSSISQAVAPCFLGRVASDVHPRNPDIEGASSHRNLSPISAEGEDGMWNVILKKIAGKDSISEVYLEITLAYSSGPSS
jgi:hypothetical protein